MIRSPVEMPTLATIPSDSLMNNPYASEIIRSDAPQDQENAADNVVSIQSNVPVQQLTSESLESYTNVDTYVDKSPCINPNFSRIIDLSVTPSPPPITEEASEYSTEDNASSPSKTIDTPTHHENVEPKVPLSHLIATNQYPSLNRIPPANIVQSFAPVYNQSNSQSHQQQSHAFDGENEDLYNSYVNNPYNLTLQVEQNYSQQPAVAPITTNQMSNESANMMKATTNSNNLNVFQSINYFGSTSDAAIPPGSEVLFGGP